MPLSLQVQQVFMALSEVDFVEGALIVNAHVAGTVNNVTGFRSFYASFWLICIS
jgi:hypothetical protein